MSVSSGAIRERKWFANYRSSILSKLAVTAGEHQGDERKRMVMSIRILIAAMEVVKADRYLVGREFDFQDCADSEIPSAQSIESLRL